MPHVYGLEASAEAALAAARRVSEVALKHAQDVDVRGRFPSESMHALAQERLLGLCVAPSLGGMGQVPRAFAGVTEELAQSCASTAMVYVMHVTAAQAIASSSTLEHRDALLQRIASGKHLTTLAFSEKGSRSQFWAPVSKLVEGAQGYTTSAHKSWVTSAACADSYVSSAQKPDAASPLESTVYLARKGASGMRIAASFDGLGLRGNDSAPVVIDRMSVPQSDLISAPGAGAKTMLEVVLPWFSLGTAAMANGLCCASVALTAKHLAEAGFDHTGSKLRDLWNLRARLAQMSVRTEQSRALTGFAVGEMEQPSASTPLHVLQMRCAAMEAAVDVTDLAMKACGGAAFSKQLPIERLFRDARAGWVMAPTVDHLHDFIGKALTGLPLFG